jgi:methyl-accepting chemotaxis protein
MANTNQAAVVIPGFTLTWGKIAAICGTFVIVVGGALAALIGLVYGNIHESIGRIESKVETVQQSLVAASKDSGSLQSILSEAPEIRKSIQETHDNVLRHDAKFETINAKLDNLTKASDGVQLTLADMRTKLSNIETTVQRIPGLPK